MSLKIFSKGGDTVKTLLATLVLVTKYYRFILTQLCT